MRKKRRRKERKKGSNSLLVEQGKGVSAETCSECGM
jgi:hypothetical protein